MSASTLPVSLPVPAAGRAAWWTTPPSAPVETRPVSRLQGLTAAVLSRNWTTIPHVTHHDDVDTTALDALRRTLEPKPGPLAFFAKALVSALQAFPHFNASLDASGATLVLKRYFHIGIAIDTPRGLVVGVVRDCDAQGRGAHRRRHRRAHRQGARPRAAAGGDGGRLHVDQLAGRHRRHRLHADRQRARGRDPGRHQGAGEAPPRRGRRASNGG